jgi:hypothetical protein
MYYDADIKPRLVKILFLQAPLLTKEWPTCVDHLANAVGLLAILETIFES